MDRINGLLRQLPKIDDLAADKRLQAKIAEVGHALSLEVLRDCIEDVRQGVLDETIDSIDYDNIVSAIDARLSLAARPSLRRVINATGIIIHTNLGRSALAPAAMQAVQDVSGSYSTLEYDVDNRTRGSRHAHVEKLLCRVTGAEAAMAVNNNAAAVLLVLSEFARGREAVVSRGELIEIGGSFRIPDIMQQSNARLVEVGATNKTHLRDYERAIRECTALLMKVHPSNFRLMGFTESVAIPQVTELAHKHGLLAYEDQGSGILFDLPCFTKNAEPTVRSSVEGGCDLVSFSGDKLLGGPQAGIIVGTKEHISRLKQHPLARALRLDKMTLAALEATMRICLDKEKALQQIPTLRMLTQTCEELRPAADYLYNEIARAVGSSAKVEIIDEISRAGGGAMPLADIPTLAVRVVPTVASCEEVDAYLVTEREIPIICRTKDNALLFDVRTVLDSSEAAEIATALGDCLCSVDV